VYSTGPAGLVLGVVLTTAPCKKFLATKPHIKELCEAAKVLQEMYTHRGGGGRGVIIPLHKQHTMKVYGCMYIKLHSFLILRADGDQRSASHRKTANTTH